MLSIDNARIGRKISATKD